jgi:uncharacterized delta-60 repeat protein
MARAPIRRTRTRPGPALKQRPLRSAAVLVAAIVLGVFLSASAQAAPGDLDPMFSGDGQQTTDFQFGLSGAAAIVHQPDGKIIAVGDDRFHGSSDFAIARYSPNGSLDTSFSGDGKERTDFNGFDDGATGVALQGDGKVVAVGSADAGGYFAVARYNPDGTLDTSFSGDGKQTTSFDGFENGATGVAIQGDGKIVVVGQTSENGAHFGAFAIARYNPNGSLDTTFSGDGKQTADFDSFLARDDVATGVALQANGKIVVVGFAGQCDFALVRYNVNGSLDTSFSGDGKQRTHFGACGLANGVALQANGRIVVVGEVGGNDFALARYNSNGSLDTSFSGDGKQTTDFGGGADGANGVAIQGDGKIVVAGGGGVGDDFALARYNPNGSLDTSFSGDGRQTASFLGGGAAAAGVSLQSGKIVAVGRATGTVSSDFALARYNSNGSLDTSFSGDGTQTTDFRGGVDEGASAVTLQPDGKIVAVGGAGSHDFALARYSTNGTLDTSFADDGRQTTNFRAFDQANGVALQANNKVVAVGGTGSGLVSDDFALARYNANGTLDTSFSGDGRQTTDFGLDDEAKGVVLQDDGKIVAVGGGNRDFGLARYNPNGSLDTSFSGDGKQTTDFGGFDGATGVALQADGKIVAVGGGAGVFALARYNPNGSLDTSFSGDGRQTTAFGDISVAAAVTLQGDGKIVVVGSSFTSGAGQDFALARYNSNGSLDTSFSGDGKQTTDFLGGSDAASGSALQGDGKIVAVGVAGDFPARDFALARYNLNGSLDTTFSGDGKQTTDFGGDDEGTGVALQSDAKIVTVGVGRGPNQTDDFALARYLGG